MMMIVALLIAAANPPPAEPPRMEIGARLGQGKARLIVQWRDTDRKRPLTMRGVDGAVHEFPADGQSQTIQVEAGFPNATRLAIDGEEIHAVFRAGKPLYLLSDLCAGWALLADWLDPRAGRKPDVVCRRAAAGCPSGFAGSVEPPLHRDRRCPDPRRASSKTAQLCYRPGHVRFQSRAPKVIKIVHSVTGASETIRLAPGQPSEPSPFQYERCRPHMLQVDGRSYVLAIGFGEDWLVTITDQGIAAEVQPKTRARPRR
jgi:hypothetical protein